LGETTAGGASGGAHSYEAQSPRPWPISAHDHTRRYCRTQLLAPPKQQAWPGLLPPPARHSGIACCTHAARQITLRPSALQVSRTHLRSQHSTALLPPSADGGLVGWWVRSCSHPDPHGNLGNVHRGTSSQPEVTPALLTPRPFHRHGLRAGTRKPAQRIVAPGAGGLCPVPEQAARP
jgi:hypothetical protein